MKSPLTCLNAIRHISSVDKIKIFRGFVNFLTSVAPVVTFFIITSLIYFTYQLLPLSWTSTFLLYFFITELFGNWILFFTNKCFITKNAGNSELASGLSHLETSKLCYCPTCKIYKPERSHHCVLCNRCIHQRDHHCFFLGTCVGRYNLCYFIYFCFYASIGCFYSLTELHSFYSMKFSRPFLSSYYHYYFYPVTVVHWMNEKADLVEVGWVTLMYIAFASSAFTGFCVLQQMVYVLRGQTAYEYNKGLLTVHRSAVHNFIDVFGQFWFVRLIIPLPKKHQKADPRSFLKII